MIDIYTLYGAQISNYSAKVRSYLIYRNIPFQEVVASNYVYDKLLVPTIGFRMMPVVRTPDGRLLQDSTEIIDSLEMHFPNAPVYPSGARQRLAALLLEAYAHDWVRIPAMYYRWGFPEYNHEYLIREFGRMYEPTLSLESQAALGDSSSAWTRDRLPALGVTKRTIPQFEAWTEKLLGWLNAHFDRYPYLLGTKPCTADFTFMGPLYGHLYRDPYSHALIKRSAPSVVRWVERMNSVPASEGAFLPDDEVPASLLPMLLHAFEEYVPVAYDTVERVAAWIEGHPGEPVPRFLGTHKFTIGGVTEDRNVWTCIQFMIQRPLAAYQSAKDADRAEMDSLLSSIGPNCGLDFRVARPVKREHYKLVAAS
ncbi:glutathione S-transferase family protein [Bradyrhizobium sp. Ash2021]|uniref:glutathione S-transferase family protein n=1 Tax=Bradyrhizobium sp. Ash2021 TaxID=2954771 RepID=UPI002815C05F|nr:glutathione S-transferase family protein [Bradyrhizobium sp. Ash2021]WMT76321.1 glutathione S-transferase family protein [Bradyrhizobium sp. Ash2021]